MIMRRLLKRVYFILALLVSACTVPATSTNLAPAPPPAIPMGPPNVIYILADDMGYGDLSLLGQRSFATPNIDRLAAEGMLFTQHYAGSAVCAPSRGSLMTGLHTGHAPIRGNMGLPGIGTVPLPDSVPTLPELLKRGTDYTTAITGRWHLGGELSDQTPYDRGFDYAFGKLSSDFPNRTGEFNGALWDENGKHLPYEVYSARNVEPMYLNGQYYDLTAEDMAADTINMDRMVTERAVDYILAERQQPYFLYVAYSIPHEPMDYHPNYPVPDTLPAAERAFVSMMLALDDYVGRITDAVDASGQSEHTVIVFTSDNGAHNEGGHRYDYFDSSGPFTEYKRSFHEGGMRAPMIVRWPGMVAAGSRSDHLCAMYDVLPTVLELGGAEPAPRTDGISFAPTLRGEPQPAHDYLYWEFNENIRFQKTEWKQAVRTPEWKAIRYVENDSFELYRITEDLGETHNVAEQYPGVVARMRAIMAEAHTPSPVFPLLNEERAAASGATDPKRPNIIMLLADDLGYGDLSGYGSSTIETPHIDALMERGLRFTRFYAGSAVCTPSRASFMTGRYPLRFDIRKHFGDRQEHLPTAAVTLPELLGGAGYRTIHIGKWHLGGLRPQDFGARTAGETANPGPLQHGFDHSLTSIEGAPIRPELIKERKLYREGGKYMVRNDRRAPEDPGHWTEIKVNEAIAQIDTSRALGQPFFVNLWFDVPHTPYEPAPEPHLSKYVALGAEGDQLYFRSMVSHLDANVGRLIDHLEREGLLDNTLIVFTSDNGPAFQGSPGPFRGGKTDLHEGGIRVPMFAVWSGHIPAGTHTFTAAHMADLLPTFCGAAGVEDVPDGVDGQNILPLLTDPAYAERGPLLWQMDLYRNFQNQGPKPLPYATEVVTDGRWKLLAFEGEPTELFDLVVDQRELYNLLEERPEVVERLRPLLRDFLAAPRDDSGFTETASRK